MHKLYELTQRIPILAKIVAALAFVLFFFGIFAQYRANGLAALLGLVAGALAGTYFLLAGYIYADAPQRGMPPIPWTALAVIVPNCVGFVLYFVLRKPILRPCPGCAGGVAPDAAFCSRCGQPQMKKDEPSEPGART